MADYAIGDTQGCFDSLCRLLEKVHFNDRADRLWFAGDLVNRGPKSLAVLRFIKQLPVKPRISLGNHDLHLLAQIFVKDAYHSDEDTLQEILNAPDAKELGHWLRQQSILYYDQELNVVMTHAGIAPMWNLELAISLAAELEAALTGDDFCGFLNQMYGNKPDVWDNNLKGIERLRVICNYFTRMRFCDVDGRLNFKHKEGPNDAPVDLYPWYQKPNRVEIAAVLVFGHWATLVGQCPHPKIQAIDTGCFWGGELTALRLQDFQRFSVAGCEK